MSEATPPWRGFSSDATEAATTEARARRWTAPPWLAPLLAGVGGLGLGVAMVGLAVLTMGALANGRDPSPRPQPLVAPAAPQEANARSVLPGEIVVDVAGAVVHPGLHRLRPGDRVGDAIEIAGGFAPRADLAATASSLNLAQPLEDGAKVLVPELGIDRITGGAGSDDGRIDLNRASRSELESLPGIGPVTAGKIIEAREDARFGAVSELRSRGIVGEKVYGDIKGLVRAG